MDGQGQKKFVTKTKGQLGSWKQVALMNLSNTLQVKSPGLITRK